MSPPYHAPLVIGEYAYAFSHLDPFQMHIDSTRAGKRLRIHVRFMSQCFTEKYDAACHPAGEPILHDTAGRPRSFCRIRYGISARLPAMIVALNHPRVRVIQTARERNWLHSVSIDEPRGKYHIFFELRRAAMGDRERQDLNLTVESAYHQDPSRSEPAVRGAMGFILLCGKVYKGEPVSTRR
jgi:hypothetical protein